MCGGPKTRKTMITLLDWQGLKKTQHGEPTNTGQTVISGMETSPGDYYRPVET